MYRVQVTDLTGIQQYFTYSQEISRKNYNSIKFLKSEGFRNTRILVYRRIRYFTYPKSMLEPCQPCHLQQWQYRAQEDCFEIFHHLQVPKY